jgi:hypothetical protein
MTAPDFRELGRLGGLTTASRNDMCAVAANARKSAPSSLEGYWYPKVDPRNELDLSDRDRRARAAQRRYFADMARKRKAKQNGGGP